MLEWQKMTIDTPWCRDQWRKGNAWQMACDMRGNSFRGLQWAKTGQSLTLPVGLFDPSGEKPRVIRQEVSRGDIPNSGTLQSKFRKIECRCRGTGRIIHREEEPQQSIAQDTLHLGSDIRRPRRQSRPSPCVLLARVFLVSGGVEFSPTSVFSRL